MAFRFLHLADLHLDTVFGGSEATRARLRVATREAFERAVSHCIDEQLDALLIAGDAFDDERLSLSVQGFFQGQMQRLLRNGISAFYVTGNHDPGNAKATDLGFADAPEQVGPEPGLWIYRKATPRATTLLDRSGKALAVLLGAGHNKSDVTTNLAAKFKRPKTDLPVVGLLHTQVEAARISNEHKKYAPSTLEDYQNADLDYWALGHVHLRQQVFEDMPVYYAGNLLGRNPKETGPKGGLQVQIHPEEAPKVEFVSFAPIEWHHLAVSGLEKIDSPGALLEFFAGTLSEFTQAATLEPDQLCVRVLPEGSCPMAALLRDPVECESLAEELREQSGLLELQIRARNLTAPRDLSDLLDTPSVQQEALTLLRSIQTGSEGAGELLYTLKPKDLPGAAAQGIESREAQIEYLRELMDGLEEEFLERGFDQGAWS